MAALNVIKLTLSAAIPVLKESLRTFINKIYSFSLIKDVAVEENCSYFWKVVVCEKHWF